MKGPAPNQSVPDYDPLKLMVLAHEAGETAAQRFLDDYLGLLPRRQDRILAELSKGEMEEAMDAVVSLKVTSSMVGAIRLNGYCQQLQDQLTVGNIADAAAVAADLAVLVPAFIRAVKEPTTPVSILDGRLPVLPQPTVSSGVVLEEPQRTPPRFTSYF
jgi:hypothetical protein